MFSSQNSEWYCDIFKFVSKGYVFTNILAWCNYCNSYTLTFFIFFRWCILLLDVELLSEDLGERCLRDFLRWRPIFHYFGRLVKQHNISNSTRFLAARRHSIIEKYHNHLKHSLIYVFLLQLELGIAIVLNIIVRLTISQTEWSY